MKTFAKIILFTAFLSTVILNGLVLKDAYSQKTLYTPNDNTVKKTYYYELKESVYDPIKKSINYDPSMYAKMTYKKLDIIEANSKTVKYSFVFADMKPLTVLDYSEDQKNLIGIKLREDLAVGWLSCDNCREKDINYAKRLADAFYALRNKRFYQINIEEEINKFKPISDAYRDLNPKPEVNEEARKLIIQATIQAKEQKYYDAIVLYSKAIELDPTYPEAHFNMALLLSQEDDYEYAILEMKKYLMLVPDAKDARTAQDKIYEWELKLK